MSLKKKVLRNIFRLSTVVNRSAHQNDLEDSLSGLLVPSDLVRKAGSLCKTAKKRSSAVSRKESKGETSVVLVREG